MIYFIADTHFGHENIVKMCNRPFDSIEDMKEKMIASWNRRVKGNDTVYIVGDMFFRCKDPEPILRRLHGRKKLIVGNHDGSWMKNNERLLECFESVDKLLEASDGTRAIVLCHYPLLTWKHQKRSYMIHGHIHAETTSDYWPLIKCRDRMLNAGVDINGYEPVTFEELVANNKRFKLEH